MDERNRFILNSYGYREYKLERQIARIIKGD